jgi:hypothetical protein
MFTHDRRQRSGIIDTVTPCNRIVPKKVTVVQLADKILQNPKNDYHVYNPPVLNQMN